MFLQNIIALTYRCTGKIALTRVKSNKVEALEEPDVDQSELLGGTVCSSHSVCYPSVQSAV